MSRKLWWHYRVNGQEFEQTRADSEGQGSLVCCSPWGHRVGHHRETEQQSAFGGAHLYRFLHPLCALPPRHPVSSFSFVTSRGLGLRLCLDPVLWTCRLLGIAFTPSPLSASCSLPAFPESLCLGFPESLTPVLHTCGII